VQVGNDVYLTIDGRLQKAAAEALGDRVGAVVVLEPRTGEILALVSNPCFDTGKLASNWDTLVSDRDNPFLNRSIRGLYPPGSTFKIITLAAALESGRVSPAEKFADQGSLSVDGYTLSNPGQTVYGLVDLERALAVSSNVVFARLALLGGADLLTHYIRAFGLGTRLLSEIPAASGTVPELNAPQEVAACGIGQGRLLVTPLHMAVVTASVANGGVLVRPHLVRGIYDASGRRLAGPRYQARRVISQGTARYIAGAMLAVVDEGTGFRAGIEDLQVAGKTGSAENPAGAAHAWFVGFAPAGDPELALAVMVENAGAGGRIAAPIARNIIEAGMTIGLRYAER